jgi:hypothetical protein
MIDREEFDQIAYAYRSWPATDPAGVAQRFEELLAYVEKLISENKQTAA